MRPAQLADLADERARFYLERKRQLQLHAGMDSMLQRVTAAWRGDDVQRYFKQWRENAAANKHHRRVVEQIQRTRLKLITIKVRARRGAGGKGERGLRGRRRHVSDLPNQADMPPRCDSSPASGA